MSDPGDDRLSRRYRELAREEPSAELDARILAASRENRGLTPGEKRRDGSRVTGVRPQWPVPVSIAAVLVLGIGVSLRMQMEEPGIETSTAMSSPASEYSLPAEAPPPQAAPAPKAAEQPKPVESAIGQREVEKKRDERALARAKPEAPQRLELQSNRTDTATGAAAPRPEPNPFTDAPVVMQQAPSAAASPATTLAVPAPARIEEREMKARESRVLAPPPAAAPMPATPPAPAARPAPAPASAPRQEPPAAAVPQSAAGVAADAAAPRAKVESSASGMLGAQALRKSIAVPDPNPERELERIAKLREAGNHAEADRALEQFRRDHRDFRIPEAMWERVRPR